MKNSAGTQQTATIYGTTGEAGTNYLRLMVNDVPAYVTLVETSNALATSGRVLKDSKTYAVASNSIPAYGYGYYTTSGTFTVPTGVVRLRVTCVGGGAGGATAAISNSSIHLPETFVESSTWEGANRSGYSKGTAGGKTTFGSVSAAGATYAVFNWYYYIYTDSEGWESSEYQWKGTYPSEGTVNGYVGSTGSNKAGSPAVPLLDYKGNQIGTAGAGGYADGGGNFTIIAAGASGYSKTGVITVTPGQKISYTVGTGGKGWHDRKYRTAEVNSGGTGVNVGGAGAILVEWGRGIQ